MSAVTYARYLQVTGDTVTASSDVMAAIDEATLLLEDALDRTLTLGTYTETHAPDADGYVYPRAVPVTAVVAPAVLVDTVTVSGGTPQTVDPWNTTGRPVTVTYTGGYAELPAPLSRAVCELARALTPGGAPQFKGLAPNVQQVQVGDVSVSLSVTGRTGPQYATIDDLVPGIGLRVRRFRRAGRVSYRPVSRSAGEVRL